MRIIGGRFRGRALTSVGKGDDAARLRPTSDRVREALFNVLAHGDYPPLEGARVLDLFAGTGALGLEALSRGAAHVTFVEKGRVGAGIIAKNIELFQVVGEVSLLKRDALKPGIPTGEPYDIAFADPPYGKGLGGAALTAWGAAGWLRKGALLVLEEGAEVAFPTEMTLKTARRYGDTWVHLGVWDG